MRVSIAQQAFAIFLSSSSSQSFHGFSDAFVAVPNPVVTTTTENSGSGSISSGNHHRNYHHYRDDAHQKKQKQKTSSTTRLRYDIQRDPPLSDNNNGNGGGGGAPTNVWSVLSNTEKWISDTLRDAAERTQKNAEKKIQPPQNNANSGSGSVNAAQTQNPLSRKEVSYVCETNRDPAVIAANVFRRVKEARQLGESHAKDREEEIDEQSQQQSRGGGGKKEENRPTLRQTQVLVIPANEQFNANFHNFDGMINAINAARRAARDYVTDHSLEKLDDEEDRDWVVSVNCAHLHPKFGEKTPEQELKEMKEEEENGEVDLNLQEYKRQRVMARRSPYPSIVIEVRAMPPPEFTPPPKTGPVSPKSVDDLEDDDEDIIEKQPAVSSDVVQRLESLFAKSSLDNNNPPDSATGAATNSSSNNNNNNNGKDHFYESIGSHIETFSSVTPLMVAQNWIDKNDPLFEVTRCAFTVSEATHVDEAYEFVFTNVGMQSSQFSSSSPGVDDNDPGKQSTPAVGNDNVNTNRNKNSGAQKRQYLVMPHFLSSSATSLEKFSGECENILRTLPVVGRNVEVSCLHPEHVEESKRCPVPTFILQWKDSE